jgi:hypothetical protein
MRILILTILAAAFPMPAQAYVGPGLGIGAVLVVLAILLSILLAVIGLFWYPIKRRMKKKSEQESDS